MPTFANTIDNNEILAKRSQCDYAGNDIQTTYATKSEVTTGLASKQDTISDLSTIRSDAAAGATAVQPGDLATVASTGAYSDLTGTPTIPPALSAGNGIDITNNVVSADLDGTSLTNGANGLSVTLPVPDTTGASQGDVLSVGQSGIEWVTPSGGGGDDAVLTYNVSTWSDFTTAYNAGKNIRVVETVDGTTYEAVLFEYNPNGSPYGYAKFTATTLRTGVGAVSSNWYQISNTGSGVWTRGAGTIQGNYDGQGAISVSSASHMISLTLDGSSLTQSSSGLAVANPLPNTLGTAGQVLQVNSGATGVEWATPSGGGSVTDVEVNGTSVVNASGVAEVTIPAQVNADWNSSSGASEILNKPTIPTVDQTYDGTSTNAQSGTAVADALATVSQVPAVTSSDNNKTLVATYSNGVGSYAWAQNTFMAVYGTTTYAEIKAAIDAGYSVLCLKTDPSWTDSSCAGGIGYIYMYNNPSYGNFEFNYFQPLPNSSQATASNQGIAQIHIWKVDYNNNWTSKAVVVAPKIIANSPLSLSYSNANREVTLGVSLGSTLTTSGGSIEVAAPIPDVTSVDNGKVLKATYSGGVGSYAWATESGGGGGGGGGGTTYTAGNMISLANNEIAVSTTAGITDVQQVAALPAQPVATVLYLIPET